MKMNKHILLAAAAAGIFLSGCIKEKGVEPGSAISFSASSAALETRTVYGADASTKQYIDWVSGDRMTIAKVHGSATQACDYSVNTRTVSTASDKSVATVTASPATGQSALTWNGEGSHTFYAMYPAGTLSVNVLSGTVAASQTADMNMPSGYMFATKTVDVGPTYTVKTVDLEFEPSFTAFQFTLNNPTSEAVTLTSFSLSSATKALNGAISYDFSASSPVVSHPTATNVDAERTISSDASITVPANGSVTFVFTALPNSFPTNDLSISCTANGTTRTLHLTHAFGTNLKHNLTITLPTFASYEYTFEVVDPVDLADLDGNSNTASIRSYKSNDGGTTKTAVSWSVEGYYTTAQDAAAGTSPLGSKPSWLTTTIAPSGVSDQTLSLDYTTSTTTESTGLGTVINAQIKANTSAGGTSSAAAVNLADAARGTGTTITESANCYIVNGPGWYKIPLVMGNGVIGDALNSNEKTYKGGGSNDNAVSFYDYNCSVVTTPVLSSPSTASVIWEDFSGLVSLPATNFTSTSTVSGTTVYWLVFQVPEASIVQGNAIVAVKDSAGKVMWSYHIWVTDYVSSMDATNNMSSLLGWVTSEGSFSRSLEEKVYLRLVQSETNEMKVLSLEVPAGKPTSVSVSDGYAPYYQWGRKDPIRPKTVVFSGAGFLDYVKVASSNGGYAAIYYESILNPGYLMLPYSNTMTFWGLSVHTDNLWNAGNVEVGSTSSVTKTIYDPCPAGYSVPYSNLIKSMNISSYIGQGWRDPGYKIHSYANHSTSSDHQTNDGIVKDAGNLFLWSADIYQSNYNQALSYQSSTSSNVHSLKMNALSILPMKQ